MEAQNYDRLGLIDRLPFDLRNGTIELAGERLVIRCAVDGEDREVTGPRKICETWDKLAGA